MEEAYIEEKTTCPVCGREAWHRVKRIQTRIGLVEVRSISCDFCGYKHSDEHLIQPLEYGPEEIILRIENPSDLRRYILKSRHAIIEIPELGIEIYPGPDARDEIYPVEGLLEKYIDRISGYCENSENQEECMNIVGKLRRVLEYGEKITILIRDPSRLSRELENI